MLWLQSHRPCFIRLLKLHSVLANIITAQRGKGGASSLPWMSLIQKPVLMLSICWLETLKSTQPPVWPVCVAEHNTDVLRLIKTIWCRQTDLYTALHVEQTQSNTGMQKVKYFLWGFVLVYNKSGGIYISHKSLNMLLCSPASCFHSSTDAERYTVDLSVLFNEKKLSAPNQNMCVFFFKTFQKICPL